MYEEKPRRILLNKIVQTCVACPSQWDAWDDKGNYYYFRFRHGNGRVHQYPDEHWWEPDPGYIVDHPNDVMVTFHHEEKDGVISLTDFIGTVNEVQNYYHFYYDSWTEIVDYEFA